MRRLLRCRPRPAIRWRPPAGAARCGPSAARRARGLAVGVDLVSDRESREPKPVATAAKVIYRAYQLGAVFFYVGLRANVLELTPPLTLSAAEAREGIEIIDQALTDVKRGLVSDADVAPFMMW